MVTPTVANWVAESLHAFVLCPDGRCRFSEGFADLRCAPHTCPRCGHPLLAACPHCGMLLRNRWGLCTNCGQFARPVTPAAAPPTLKPA